MLWKSLKKIILVLCQGYYEDENMRWENESLRPEILDFMNSMDIVSEAYHEGFINWNVYQKVMDRIRSNMKGSWMFEQEINHKEERR